MRLILFFISILFLVSCQEETRVNSFSGKLFLDCRTTNSGSEIALKANIGNSFSEQILLGGAVTQEGGNFNFTYELEENDKGTGDIILINSQGFSTLYKDIPVNRDNNLNVYITNLTNIFVNLSGSRNWQMTDTLFYFIDEPDSSFSIVQPQNGIIDTLERIIIRSFQGPTEATFVYGIGSSNFQDAIDSLDSPESTYQQIPLELLGCEMDENVDLIID